MIDNKKDTKGCLFVGEGVTVKGDISLPGAIFVDGRVDGTVEARELFVGTTGQVSGSAKVAKADIRGVMGQVLEAAEHVTLRSTGRVEGKIIYSTIDIERGGIVQGEMLCEAPLPAPPESLPSGDAAAERDSAPEAATEIDRSGGF